MGISQQIQNCSHSFSFIQINQEFSSWKNHVYGIFEGMIHYFHRFSLYHLSSYAHSIYPLSTRLAILYPQENVLLKDQLLLHQYQQDQLKKIIEYLEEQEESLGTYLIGLLNKPVFSYEERHHVFEMEYQFRVFLEEPEKRTEERVAFYENVIKHLVKRVKHSLVQEPQHRNAIAAAKKGQALQAGLKGMLSILEEGVPIEKNTSTQSVYSFPHYKVVYKHGSKRATEEEYLIDQFFNLCASEGIVGSFKMERLNPIRYGIEMSNLEKLKRGYSVGHLDPFLTNKLFGKLNQNDQKLYQKYKMKDCSLSQNFASFEKRTFKYEGNEVRTLQCLLEEDGFVKALTYEPTKASSDELKSLYFLPILESSVDKQTYEECEQMRWKYLNSQKIQQVVDFKMIQTLWLRGHYLKGIQAVDLNGKVIKNGPKETEVKSVLEKIQWRLGIAEVLRLNKSKDWKPVMHVQAKPFVEMKSVKDMQLHSKFLKAVLNRLSEESVWSVLLTAELQFLDLHGQNLGLAPQLNDACVYFKKAVFLVSRQVLNLWNLRKQYLEDPLLIQAEIIYKDPKTGQFVQGRLEEFSFLREALETKWEWVIFDTDLSLGESNTLHLQSYKDHIQTLIPFRSCLLELEWKDIPLSPTIIARLEDTAMEEQMIAWINRYETPIRLELKKKGILQREIDERLKPVLKQPCYTLSFARQSDCTDGSFKNIRDKFVFDLVKMEENVHQELWKWLEQQLSIDLISELPKARLNRDKIASQLFPRLTWRQLEALLERRKRRNIYLKNYRELIQTSSFEELQKSVSNFLQQSESPLSTLQRRSLEAKLHQMDPLLQTSQIALLKTEISQMCQPTYFNIVKSMYPFLSDVYDLVVASNSQGPLQAGLLIGNPYIGQLEELISLIRKKFYHREDLLEVALNLEKNMQSEIMPAFFGKWR
jgi:hypothetical protein